MEPRPAKDSETGAKVSPERSANRDTAAPPRQAPPTPRRDAPRTDQASPSFAAAPKQVGKSSGRLMVINAASEDECRIAVIQNGRLEELFFERSGSASNVGNIYKGVVTNVEASIQAAFIDFGKPKQGFLHISDVQPQYFAGGGGAPEGVGKKIPHRDRPPIQKCFRRGQEVIVQITKEGVGNKGPTLTSYLSIPGRYLVMMPGMVRLGVSRKIEDLETRRKMRELLSELKLPQESGLIIRTAGLDRNKRELQRDLNYLQRLWRTVESRARSAGPRSELYRESDLVTRTIRDVFNGDFEGAIVDDRASAERVRDFLRIVAPRTPTKIVKLYTEPAPIFHYYGIEEQIEAIHSRHVPLASGGSIVIDSTEALVAIDVNSGTFRKVSNAEETAYQINMEAALEIARQLRLRDLGGLIVCDFIDMRLDRHKRAVEKTLRDELKKHKERAHILKMSQFGLIELTRQRQGPPIKLGVYADCPHCRGTGLIMTTESMTLQVIRSLQLVAQRGDLDLIELTVSPQVASDLQNRKRAVLHRLESETGKRIVVLTDAMFAVDQMESTGQDRTGRRFRLDMEPQPGNSRN